MATQINCKELCRRMEAIGEDSNVSIDIYLFLHKYVFLYYKISSGTYTLITGNDMTRLMTADQKNPNDPNHIKKFIKEHIQMYATDADDSVQLPFYSIETDLVTVVEHISFESQKEYMDIESHIDYISITIGGTENAKFSVTRKEWEHINKKVIEIFNQQ
jgi:hypothetical protein